MEICFIILHYFVIMHFDVVRKMVDKIVQVGNRVLCFGLLGLKEGKKNRKDRGWDGFVLF